MTSFDMTSIVDRDETILWQGQPIQGFIFSKHDILLIPFSLLWCGFAIVWEMTVISSEAPLLFMIWGIPFILAGIYFVIGRFIHDTIRRAQTHYAITNRRIVIRTHGKIESIALEKWSSLKMEEFSDGTGSIKFAEDSSGGFSPFGSSRGFGVWLPSVQGVPCFFRIDQVRKVYKLLTESPAS